jgi:triacylglycerol lipase|tara:strand:- start:1059 stop:1820 length:762 start_codon:yes stop_codon:yes gene_type:complete
MSIEKLSFKEKSLLFAKLSSIAYNNMKEAKSQAKRLGFTTIEFYEKDGAQAYRFMNKTDLVIACRGTQPTEFNDLKADLKAIPVMAETVGRVHIGFKTEVDDLWPMIEEDINRKTNVTKTLWFCGHSLGAAMATIMASRAKHNVELNDPVELFTYGSPRVGWREYCNSLNVIHHRWKNNNDIVTTVPLAVMGFKHHGTEHYINAYGNVRTPTGWQMFKDRLRGMWMGIKKGKIDNFGDHSMVEYIKHIEADQD